MVKPLFRFVAGVMGIASVSSLWAQSEPTWVDLKAREAREALQLCLISEVARIDDGKLAISGISNRLQNACESDYRKMLATVGDLETRKQIEANRQMVTQEMLVSAVAVVRNFRKQSASTTK
jgi:hypothetical protein